MDILKLIKERRTVRKYKDKPVPQKIIDKIIEAGRWGPSIVGIQPGKFVVVKNKRIIERLCVILKEKHKTLSDIGGRFIFSRSIEAVSKANTLILIYDTRVFLKKAAKFGKLYIKFAKLAEISAISASIQNMILTAENLGIGSCWLDTPVFCKKEINKLIRTNDTLIAILTLGYPAEKGIRTPRRSITETVKYLDERI